MTLAYVPRRVRRVRRALRLPSEVRSARTAVRAWTCVLPRGWRRIAGGNTRLTDNSVHTTAPDRRIASREWTVVFTCDRTLGPPR
ncbi:hypothetical protein HETIRDRAFT_407673 [Heterobasidion irregulare TC 32-1]|uniref:Uncharacterized protein n=1 Tax=Heterobasidion irregulare (strain TC 32-1) TaxID=747525 RepID=W4KJB9_HETIT|nr:uncharacterized protein HETIRDRAFT_407673 [Heterobasidion irregulare TC 32-1]ETW85779.1 hypothetical protein HETIRDRAFT_407673 [Heterobasidion irregulare TC 32-1]